MSGCPDLVLVAFGRERPLAVETALGAEDTERAADAAIAWIKALRAARVDGQPLRDRFTLRGDSLWWFVELYLHKRQVVLQAHRTALALERAWSDTPFETIRVTGRDSTVAGMARSFAAARGLRIEAEGRGAATLRTGTRLKAAFHTATALLDRVRPVRAPRVRKAAVAAFVHSAFWNQARGEDAYLGPVLRELEPRLPHGALQLVGLGPRTNFRVRRWRDRVSEFGDPVARGLPLVPIETLAGWRQLAPSRRFWRSRHAIFRALASSADVRAHAMIRGLDAWAVVEPELAGVAELQIPWSTRAMDEAAAALDALEPATIVTYAEAGGWGRALLLEARRRGIPSAGVQHGFIYRHWLNYLHEPDEVQPSPGNPADAGFPRPTLTLVFDQLAAEHLERQGRLPREALAVTGSPKLDAFAATAARMSDADRARIRETVGAAPGQHIVLVAAKHAQLGGAFAALARAAADRPDVHLVVKPHPAEAAEPYLAEAGRAATIAPASANLAALTAVARLLVTANSTAAIEAMVAGVPALIVNLPNNLTPFVEAGAFAAAEAGRLAEALDRLLYDGESRERLAAARRAFMARHGIVADGQAAARSAGTILRLASPSASTPTG